jgi:hypothetical protein
VLCVVPATAARFQTFEEVDSCSLRVDRKRRPDPGLLSCYPVRVLGEFGLGILGLGGGNLMQPLSGLGGFGGRLTAQMKNEECKVENGVDAVQMKNEECRMQNVEC